MRATGVIAAVLFLSCSDGTNHTPTDPGQTVAAQQRNPIRARAVRSQPARSPLLGLWGGQHIGLDLQAGGGRVEFDCAHGTIDEPIVLAADGTFSVRGTFTLEHGGPVTNTDVENIRPARYQGKISGEVMELAIIVDGAELSQSFTLVRNQLPRIIKCL